MGWGRGGINLPRWNTQEVSLAGARKQVRGRWREVYAAEVGRGVILTSLLPPHLHPPTPPPCTLVLKSFDGSVCVCVWLSDLPGPACQERWGRWARWPSRRRRRASRAPCCPTRPGGRTAGGGGQTGSAGGGRERRLSQGEGETVVTYLSCTTIRIYTQASPPLHPPPTPPPSPTRHPVPLPCDPL